MTGSLGRYEVLGLIGAGGMARVHVVRSASGERYALKVLAVSSPSWTARFAREARLQRRVSHPNVLPVLDVLEVAGAPALLMPLVQGPSLETLLREGPLAPSQAQALFRELVQGVAALHAAGLVHRDLKPGNVLLDASADPLRVLVADFGLAKLVQDLSAQDLRAPADDVRTRTGALLGTPAYMAPEQRLDASRVDARADVYALGTVLFELLTGRRPDPGETIPETDPWLALAARCLRADPTERPETAVELEQRLPETEPLGPELCARCRTLLPAPGDALPTPCAAPHNLPSPRDRFVGRQAEIVEIGGRLAAGVRLLSLVGPAGVGKTRLALRAVEVWQEDYPGGVWFCELSDARDLQDMVTAVAAALEVPLGRGDPETQLGHALAGRGRCLVLLDNFEQLVSCACPALERWLARAPLLRLLVTSRHTLGLPEEQCLPVGPLAMEDAVELLCHRAAEREPAWVEGPQDIAVLPQIAELLDFLPLAIELCAARAPLLSPVALRARLSERFRLAASPERTLRGALDWSWELLSEDERRALAQLSVFEGGFTVQAAELVLQLEESWPMDALQGLVDKSLVYKKGQGRFALLLSVQEYAAEKLGPDRPRAELAHGSFFASLGTEDAMEAMFGPGGSQRQAAQARELGNLVTACRRAVARGDGPLAADLALAAWLVLERRGPFALGLDLLERANLLQEDAARTLPRLARARLLCGRAEEARRDYELALEVCRTSGAREREGRLLVELGAVLASQGQPAEALALYEQALDIARERQDRRGELLGHFFTGNLYTATAELEQARAHYEQGLQLARELGDRWNEAGLTASLGILLLRQGLSGESLAWLQPALALARKDGLRRRERDLLGVLGAAWRDLGRADEALACYEDALRLARETGEPHSEALLLNNLGVMAMERGQLERAQTHYEAALQVTRASGDRVLAGTLLGNLGNVHTTRGQLPLARSCYEQALQIHRDTGAPHGEAVVLGSLGWLCCEQGDLAEALSHFGAAERLLRDQSDSLLLGEVLANRASALARAGDLRGAQLSLREAEQLAEPASPDTPLGRALARTRALTSESPGSQ